MPSSEQKFITRDGKTIAWDYGQVTAKTVALCRAPKRMIRQKISTFCQTLTPSRAILVWDQRAPIYRVVSALLANYDRTVQTRQRANEAKKVKDAMVRLERMQVQHDLLKSRGATSSRVPRPRMSKYASRIPGYKELHDKLLKSADEIEASTGKKPKVNIDDDLFEHDMEQKAALPPSDPMDDGGPRMPVHNTLPVALPPPMQEALGVIRYGKKFKPGTNDLTIELYAFRHQLTPEQGGLGPFQHFKNAVDLLWNRKGSTRRFIWSPWAEEMIREACTNNYLAVAGCASSGKSDTYALWAIINYIAAPTETLVILTSTTLREARRRVWKSVEDMWLSAPGLPGKLVSSLGQIKGLQKQGDFWEGTGLVLIPSEKKAEREAVGKLLGIKAPRVILIADELPELPESIVNAAYSNLSKNPYFQMVGLGNPNSFFDAFGMFCEPKAGWGSITEDDFHWETSRGKCIRFDAELCPNVLEGKVIYPWMPTREKIDQDRAHYGPRSLAYYRMVRGFWAPEGASTGIYSEADLVRGIASRKGKFKDGTAVRVAGLDPSFSAGGDRTIAFFGTVGTCAETDLPIIQFDEYVALKEDISDKNNPRSHQLAFQFVQECTKRNVSPRNAGIDSTGGGSVFCDVLATVWGTDSFVRVAFGGGASHKAVSATDKTLAKDRYANRMSEIWYIGQELLRSGQIRNVTPDLAREMVSRQYETKKQGSMKIKVESKTEYKARTGKSPDIADAAFVMVDVARTRFGLVGNERFEINQTRQNTFRTRMMALDAVNPVTTLRFA